MGCASFPRCSRTPSVRSSQMLQRTSCSRFAFSHLLISLGRSQRARLISQSLYIRYKSYIWIQITQLLFPGLPTELFHYLSLTFCLSLFNTRFLSIFFIFFPLLLCFFPCCRPAPASLSRLGASSLSLSADIKVSHAAPLARHKLRPLVFTDFPSLRSSF